MADDRLSQLPNDLLISILSSTLTVKEAARTSILSKRWQTLWTYFYGFFDFDDDFKLPILKKNFGNWRDLFLNDEKPSVDLYMTGVFPYSSTSTCLYVNYVNKVLTCHQPFGVPIRKLRICWKLNREFRRIINSWIDFVMKNSVQYFELDLCESKNYWDWKRKEYKLPLPTLMGTAEIGSPNLTVLRLSFVDIRDATLAYLISSDKCPSLQHISVKYARSIVHVKVVGNLKLKSLELDNCWRIKDVEISSAAELVSFYFRGHFCTEITLEDVPLLTEVLFGGHYCQNVVKMAIAPRLSDFLTQLEILILDFVSMIRFTNCVTNSQFPKFDRVKHLEVETYTPRARDLNTCVMNMIDVCPRLQKFSLKMIYSGCKSKYLLMVESPCNKIQYQHGHKCLQAVEYKGWNGNDDDLKLIFDIQKSAVLLEKLTIDPSTTFVRKEHELEVNCCDGEFLINDMKREESARHVAEKLRTILHEGVTLIVL